MLQKTYNEFLQHYGSQTWWPADTPFEVMVGAILTQNTSWTNVEKAIIQLKGYPNNNPLDAKVMAMMDTETLSILIRPSGFYNIKTKRLQAFLRWFQSKNFSIDSLLEMDTIKLRCELLSINGIGKETADSILLYALDKPIFVIDAYTKRIFGRLGLSVPTDYDDFRSLFEENLKADSSIYNEYHALIVTHAKQYCRKKALCCKCFMLDCPSRKINM